MEKFINLEKTGTLYIEKILFESNYPILFTCRNDMDDLFLCVCCQDNKQGRKWLITKTRAEIILMILNDEITLRRAFLDNKEIQISVFINKYERFIRENDYDDWNYESSIYLPDKGEYMEVEDDEFAEEISYYTKHIEENYLTRDSDIVDNYKFIDCEEIDLGTITFNDIVVDVPEYINSITKYELTKEMLIGDMDIYLNIYNKISLKHDKYYEQVEMIVSNEIFNDKDDQDNNYCLNNLSEAA